MPTANALLGLVQFGICWPARAEREMQRVRRALGTSCHAVYHVGSTSVPGLAAAPIMDLMAELDDMSLNNLVRLRLMAHGFTGVAGPPPCAAFMVADTLSGTRTVELFLYPLGHEEVRLAVAFFACLRLQPEIAAAYGMMKLQARTRHGAGTSGYAAEKRAWMQHHARLSHDLPSHPVR